MDTEFHNIWLWLTFVSILGLLSLPIQMSNLILLNRLRPLSALNFLDSLPGGQWSVCIIIQIFSVRNFNNWTTWFGERGYFMTRILMRRMAIVNSERVSYRHNDWLSIAMMSLFYSVGIESKAIYMETEIDVYTESATSPGCLMIDKKVDLPKLHVIK